MTASLHVEEVLWVGHEDLKGEHLAYVKEMANRVGFTILCPEPGCGEHAYRIALHISMDDPVFVVRLRNR
jgi:hypothetical protein